MKCSACCTTRSKGFRSFVRAILLALSGMALFAGVLQAQEDAAAYVTHLSVVNSIDGKGASPWHLKLSYISPNGALGAAGSGTIEEWWANPSQWRQEWTSGGVSQTLVRTSAGVFRTPNSTPVPYVVGLM